MKFNLKLFVLVGVLVGLRDVWGVEENEDDDGFIVDGLKNTKEENEVKDAMVKRRVIRAVYETEYGGNVSIIHGTFKKKLFKVLVRAGKGENGVKEVDNSSMDSEKGRLYYNMKENVEYTVYFIFNDVIVDSTKNMFSECKNLIYADLSKFNTTSVTSMSNMFYECTALTDLNLSKFDTISVTNMSYMFAYCMALTELDLSNFDTKKVTNMSFMFYACPSLKELNLSNFYTTKVKNMSCMFAWCSSLKELNLSSFDTSSVTNMDSMFYCCTDLTELDLSKFDFYHVNNIDEIFIGCKFDKLSLPKKYAKIMKRFLCFGASVIDMFILIIRGLLD